MMHTRIRTRIISTLLSAAMCLSMFPAQAFAATVEAKLQVEAETQSPIVVLDGDAETVEDASEAAEQVQELAAQPRCCLLYTSVLMIRVRIRVCTMSVQLLLGEIPVWAVKLPLL